MHELTPLLIENSPNKRYNSICIIAPAASGHFYEKRCLSMSKAQNEIEEFIYKICYRPIWDSVNSYIAAHPTILNLSMSRIKYPDTAMLLDMLLEYATHTSTLMKTPSSLMQSLAVLSNYSGLMNTAEICP